MTKTEANEFVLNLTTEEKDAVYRRLWADHVRYDVEQYLHEMDEDFSGYGADDFKNLIDAVTDRYVYEGDYDCDMCYWSNLESIIKEEMERHKNNQVSYSHEM